MGERINDTSKWLRDRKVNSTEHVGINGNHELFCYDESFSQHPPLMDHINTQSVSYLTHGILVLGTSELVFPTTYVPLH